MFRFLIVTVMLLQVAGSNAYAPPGANVMVAGADEALQSLVRSSPDASLP